MPPPKLPKPRKTTLKRTAEMIYATTKKGKRPDLGEHSFKSRWEANFARYLNFLVKWNHIHSWDYEPDTFWFENIKRGVRSYCPDFKVWKSPDSEPYYIEVKGYMDNKSKTKIKRMKKYYPNVKLEVVDSKEYASIQREYAPMIPNWEK